MSSEASTRAKPAVPVSTAGTQAYSPSSILAIMRNLYVSNEEKKPIRVRGVYEKVTTGKSYNGYWYDRLKDEGADFSITLVVPELIRNKLQPNKTVELICYLTKQVEKTGAIKVLANTMELVSQTVNKFSEEDIKALEVQQRKSQMGNKDLGAFIKKCIFEKRKPVVKIVIGRTGIIQEDIKAQMGEAGSHYDIAFVPTTLTSVPAIKETLSHLNRDDVDVVVLSRGGGENVDVLDKPELAEYCITLKPIFVTAIAHKSVVPLLERIADRKFLSPTAFGQYLKETYDQFVQDTERSKAKLVADVKSQLDTQYGKQLVALNQQITTLNQQIKSEQELKQKTLMDRESVHAREVSTLKGQIERQDKLVSQHRRMPSRQGKVLHRYGLPL